MRNLMRNVSHNSRRAGKMTVNLETNPAKPPATGGTLSSAGNVFSAICAIFRGQSYSFVLRQSDAVQNYRTDPALQHVGDEFASVEWREVIQLLACPDKSGRQSKFILHCNHDAAFAAAVDLRHN